jgi:hypothetical protein
MTQNFIFAQDVILDPDTGRSSPSFETAGSGATGLRSLSSLARKCMI